MNNLFYLIVPLTFVLIVNIIMTVAYKDTEKKDKGFVFNYYKLSYRRKFVRALWNIPFTILVYLYIYSLDVLNPAEYLTVGIFFFLIVIIDIVYNYVRWKKGGNV